MQRILLSLLLASSTAVTVRAQDVAAPASFAATLAERRSNLACATDADPQTMVRRDLSDFYRLTGRPRLALLELDVADRLAESDRDKLLIQARRGGLLLAVGRPAEALPLLRSAEERRGDLESHLQLQLANDLATALAVTGNRTEAIVMFDRVRSLAVERNDSTATATAALNALRASIDDKVLKLLESRIAAADTDVARVAEPSTRAGLLIALADLQQRAVQELALDAGLLARSGALLNSVPALTSDRNILAYTYGLLGALDEADAQYESALMLTRRAIGYAEEASAEQWYRWEWQSARILQAQGRTAEAIEAFERAVFLLDQGNAQTATTTQEFARFVVPAYTQYADALLENITASDNSDGMQMRLLKVRGLLESLKRAEVADYFAAECLTVPHSDADRTRDMQQTAVLYPILLDSRMELLVESGGELHRSVVNVSRKEVTDTIRRFRLNLERPTAGDAYLAQARQLYRWLIEPVRSRLITDDVNTLVVVPEGPLRTIPLAALYDGEQFLIEQFAVATTPSVALTPTHTPAVDAGKALVGGLSKSVQGFPELANVTQEINSVAAALSTEPLGDEHFILESVSSRLAEPGLRVAHFASHGEFNRDFRKSFILTYDDRLTLEQMQRVLSSRGTDQIDLLVLSACQTAAGDDRAALGLAGVAIQSGARSALASLWSISDAATAELISVFYAELRKSGVSKADSLRRAQVKLLSTQRFSHPSFWAPYLLVGSWT